MKIAYDYLSPIQQAQLKHCRPDLHFGFPQCQQCHNGQVVGGECVQCGAEHDKEGNLIEPVVAVGIDPRYGARHHKTKRY